MALKLSLSGGGVAQAAKTLSSGTLSIGRGERNDWVLPDPDRHLSKTHCTLSVENGQFVLTDLSTNGVSINGARTPTSRDSRVVLTDGDEFRIGDYTFLCQEVAGGDERGGARGGDARGDAFGEDNDPLAVDPLADPLGRPRDESFQHHVRHTPQIGRTGRDPFDMQDEAKHRAHVPEEDMFAGRKPDREWVGPSQADNADANRHAMIRGRVSAPAPVPTNLDFDALIGDMSGFLSPGKPAAAPPGYPQQGHPQQGHPQPGYPPPQGTGRPAPADPFGSFDDLMNPRPAAPPAAPPGYPPQAAPPGYPPQATPPGYPPQAAPPAYPPQHPAPPPAYPQHVPAPQPGAASGPPPLPTHARGPAADPFGGLDLPAAPPQVQAPPASPPPHAAYPAAQHPPPPLPAAPAAEPNPFDQPPSRPVPAAASPAPVHPADPAPAHASGTDARTGLDAFLAGAGVPKATVTDDPEAALRAAGQVFRALVEGLREVLMSRAAIKSELRVEQTLMRSNNNNPLKFSFNPDEAVVALLGPGRPGYMPPLKAAKEGFDDIKTHEVAVMAGVQTALVGLLKRFDPDTLESRLTQGILTSMLPAARKSRLWDNFRELHKTIASEAEDDFQAVFGRSFAKAYQEQSGKET